MTEFLNEFLLKTLRLHFIFFNFYSFFANLVRMDGMEMDEKFWKLCNSNDFKLSAYFMHTKLMV